MATVQEGLFEELKGDSLISAKVLYDVNKYHIYPMVIPAEQLQQAEEGERYFIVYQNLSDRPINDVDVKNELYQVTCVADVYENMLSLKADVERVLNRFKGDLGSVFAVKYIYIENTRNDRNPDTNMFYGIFDVRIKYQGVNV